MNRKYLMAFILLIAISTAKASDVNKYSCNTLDRKQITSTIYKYLDRYTAMKSKKVKIVSQKCVGNYASAIIHPIEPVTDDATVYLNKIKGQWKIMALGTAFDEKLIAKLPKALNEIK